MRLALTIVYADLLEPGQYGLVGTLVATIGLLPVFSWLDLVELWTG